MADDKRKNDGRDRSRVSGSDDYEVEYFARETGISRDDARALIARHGNQRDVLLQEAMKLKSAG
jgi:hypothetical protein